MKKSQNVKTVVVERHYALTSKTCPQCGKEFMGTKKAVYCSRACTRAASYARHAEERRIDQRERYQARKAETEGKR